MASTMPLLWLTLVCMIATSHAAMSYAEMLADLYRIEEMENDLRDPYESEGRLSSRGGAGWTEEEPGYGEIFSEAHIRDPEFEPQNPLYGYQYMSGGAGEGKQHLTPTGALENKPEVKTDKVLPEYCRPPNPCPVGYTSADGCVEDLDNSAETNQRFNSEQECACDAEHMFKCPSGSKKISTKSSESDEDSAELSQVLNQLVGLGANQDSGYTEKIINRVAKKSPHMIRKREAEVPDSPFNPHFQGPKLRRASKKSPDAAQQLNFEFK